ncbi:MAG: DUF2971 domain-containing protein [Proteobacteria bacterium]|nr:MAG: DUF2971 domain-containing protein [Pseudomonadota bacterium]
MRLYYLTQLKTLEEFILPDQRIRISTFDKVNDPFELLGAIRGGKAAHHDFEWLRKHWTETQGFISFSENWASPLMWAHYAMNHTGVCLGVEVPDHKPMKMDYQPRRIALDFDFKKFENAADLDLLRRIAATKFDEWKYEHEWRLLLPLEHDARQPRPEHFFESFTPDFELREVILGARCERRLSVIAEQIFGVTATVHVKRARPAFDSFSMVRQKLQYPISVDPIRDFTRKELRRAAEDRRRLARQNGETRK